MRNVMLYFLCLVLTLNVGFCKTNLNACGVDEVTGENQSENGFSLLKVVNHKGHPIRVFEHKSTGAKVVVEKTNSQYKKFNIGFRTPSEDNKGTNYVVERCILDGYKGCPIKKLFSELKKNALFHELNGLTFSDYTCYPIMSTDEDELCSLAKMCLHSVFDPRFLEDSQIFKREGIRFELDKNKRITLNGEAFKESQKNKEVIKATNETLFTNTHNQFVADGDPVEMIGLTYNDVCSAYKKFYHPSNSLIVISGDIDQERFLKWIDEDYFSKFQRKDMKGVLSYRCLNKSDLKRENVIKKFATVEEDKLSTSASFCIYIGQNLVKNKIMWNNIKFLMEDISSEPYRFLKMKGYTDINLTLLKNSLNSFVLINVFSNDKKNMNIKTLNSNFNEFLQLVKFKQNYLDSIGSLEDFKSNITKNLLICDALISQEDFMNSFIIYDDPCSENFFNIQNGNFITSNPESYSQEFMNSFIRTNLQDVNPVIIIYESVCNEKLSQSWEIKRKLNELERIKFKITEEDSNYLVWDNISNSKESLREVTNELKSLSDINIPEISQDVKTFIINDKKCYHAQTDINDIVFLQLFFDARNIVNSKQKMFYFKIFKDLVSIFLLENCRTSICEYENIILNSGCILDTSSYNSCLLFRLDVMSLNRNFVCALDKLCGWIESIDFDNKIIISKYVNNAIKEIESDGFLTTENNQTLYYNEALNSTCPYESSTVDYLVFLRCLNKNISNERFFNSLVSNIKFIKDCVLSNKSFSSAGVVNSEDDISEIKSNISRVISNLKNCPEYSVNNEINLFNTQKNDELIIIQQSDSVYSISKKIYMKQHTNIIFEVLCEIINSEYIKPNISKGSIFYSSIDLYNSCIVISVKSDNCFKDTIELINNIPKMIKNGQISKESIDAACKATAVKKFYIENKLSIAINQITSLVNNLGNFCEKYNYSVKKIKNISVEELKNYCDVF